MAVNSKKTSPTWAEKVKSLLNSSEEERINLFNKYATKVYTRAIKDREERISKLTAEAAEINERDMEMLKEFEQDLQTIAITIDTSKINTRSSIEEYFTTYDDNISSAMLKVYNHKERAVATSLKYSHTIQNLEKEIEILKSKLCLIV